MSKPIDELAWDVTAISDALKMVFDTENLNARRGVIEFLLNTLAETSCELYERLSDGEAQKVVA